MTYPSTIQGVFLAFIDARSIVVSELSGDFDRDFRELHAWALDFAETQGWTIPPATLEEIVDHFYND